jgi:hypothetical protein
MDQVTVYNFDVWDNQAGKYVRARRMATPDTIKRIKGEADLESALVVNRSDVDEYGYYSEKPTGSGA